MWFYKVRIGPDFLHELQYYASSSALPQQLTYWPLPAVMRRLGHHKNHLHYLKIDIEGHEWKVLEESLFKVGKIAVVVVVIIVVVVAGVVGIAVLVVVVDISSSSSNSSKMKLCLEKLL